MSWHTGRTVGVTLYQGDGPADMVGVMVGPHAEACDLARRVVGSVNEMDRLARWIIANVPGEPSRSEGAVDVAIRLLSEHYPPVVP
jgi:hypothetical protein